MGFCESELTQEQSDWSRIVALAASVLSVFGSSYMLLSYFLFSTRKNPLSKLVAWLAFADWLVAINNTLKLSIILANPEWYPWPLCVAFRFHFQIAAGATCGYTTCIAFFLWRSLWFHRTRVRRWEWFIFHGLSWGIPLVCVVVLVSNDLLLQSPDLHLCFPKKPWHIILWFGPILVSFALNLMFYVLIIFRIQRLKQEQKGYLGQTPQYEVVASKLSKVILRFSFYLLVFFVCWVFDVLTYVMNTIDSSCKVFAFVIIYSFLLNLQGALNFLVYGVTNDSIYRRFTSKSSLFHSILEFILSPLLIYPAFALYLRKLLHTRKASRHSVSNVLDPKHLSRTYSLQVKRMGTVDSPSEDDGNLEENDFEENASNVMSAMLRRPGGGHQSERTALVRSRQINDDESVDTA